MFLQCFLPKARQEMNNHLSCCVLISANTTCPSINRVTDHWHRISFLISDDVQCLTVYWLLNGRAYIAASLFPLYHYTLFLHRFVLRLHHLAQFCEFWVVSIWLKKPTLLSYVLEDVRKWRLISRLWSFL